MLFLFHTVHYGSRFPGQIEVYRLRFSDDCERRLSDHESTTSNKKGNSQRIGAPVSEICDNYRSHRIVSRRNE